MNAESTTDAPCLSYNVLWHRNGHLPLELKERIIGNQVNIIRRMQTNVVPRSLMNRSLNKPKNANAIQYSITSFRYYYDTVY